MADRAQGEISFVPIVTIADATDADGVDAIHHDIKGSLSGNIIYTKADANDKWFYSTTKDVTNTHANLISGSFTETGTVATTDHVKFLFIKNSGTTDGSTSTAATVLLTFDGGDPSTQNDVIEIGADEAFQCKFKDGLDVDSLHAETSTGTVRCTVCAIIDDV